ncbi:bifunctional diguanylate cyclase/phosphodiesterase, partial [Kineococcus glutinatus]|uniref:putative bifunctional diguanylate cyclase/phosphodiesterase n=1 Tax=Kineococcus glutinatus TaxID=1070872 RepID=UPI0031EAEDB8
GAPQPAAALRRAEPPAAVVLGPLAGAPVGMGLLWLDHTDGLPTAATLATLLALTLAFAKLGTLLGAVRLLDSTRRAAVTDPLTALGNRHALTHRLEELSTDGRPFALVLVDLNRFKEVNDSLGQHAGDDLLRQAGDRLRSVAGPADVAVRQGGDEFALVVTGVGLDDAAGRARRLLRALEDPYDLGGRPVRLHASIGVTAAPAQGHDPDALLRQADAAVHEAKGRGGGVVAYGPHLDGERARTAQLVAQLLDAVAAPARGTGPAGSVVVHYQPQLDPVTGACAGVEALVRWQHPERGLVPPGLFLPLAEEHGLMPALTERVLDDALARIGDFAAHGCERVSVNISATALRDGRLVDVVTAGLARHRVPPQALVLEITETELIEDLATGQRVLGELVELGVGVSIDDYGTGYSCLAHLRDLPVDELKLDRSFTADLTADARTRAIVRTTVDMAHSLGLRLVAEGVEDAATLELLRRLGVDHTQGYFHSRPLPAEELDAWLGSRAGALAGR